MQEDAGPNHSSMSDRSCGSQLSLGPSARKRSDTYKMLMGQIDRTSSNTANNLDGQKDSNSQDEDKDSDEEDGAQETLAEVLKQSGHASGEQCVLEAVRCGRTVERVTERGTLITGKLWKFKLGTWDGKVKWKPRLFLLDVGNDRLMYCRENREPRKFLGLFSVARKKAADTATSDEERAVEAFNSNPVTLRSHYILKIEEETDGEDKRPAPASSFMVTHVQEHPHGNHLDPDTGRPLGRRRFLRVCCSNPEEKVQWMSALHRWLEAKRGGS